MVLYFYPKDDTPGCTTEALDFTRLAQEFEAAGVTFHEADVPAYRKATASYYTSFPKWPAGLHEKVLAAAKGQ